MKKSLVLSLGIIFTLFCFYCTSAYAEDMSFEIRWLNPSIDADAKSDSINYRNGSVDFKDDLGMGDKAVPEFNLQVNKNIRVKYMKLSNSGYAVLKDRLEFDNNVYNAGTPVSSDLDISYLRAAWMRPLVNTDTIKTNWLLELKGFKIDSSVTGVDNAGRLVSSSEKFTGVVPTVGLGIKSKLDKKGNFTASAEVTGLPLGGYGGIYDMEAELKYSPVEDFNIAVGYRAFKLKAKHSDEEVNYKFDGPYFGLQYEF
ncbi:MAG: hypothetical protein ACI3ZR_08305 [bacterium]